MVYKRIILDDVEYDLVPVKKTVVSTANRKCQNCGKPINGNIRKKNCSAKCRYQYSNRINPRGYGQELCVEIKKWNDDHMDDDVSWEAHNCVTEEDEEHLMRIDRLRRKIRK